MEKEASMKDHVLKPIEIDDIEDFVADSTIDLSDIDGGTKLISIFDDELSEIYRFKQAPQNSKEFAQMLMSKYRLGKVVEEELEGIIDELVRLGMDIEREHMFLSKAIDEVMQDGTISVSDEISEELGMDNLSVDVKDDSKAEASEISWARTGLIAALGLGISSAINSLKSKSRSVEKKKEIEINIAA